MRHIDLNKLEQVMGEEKFQEWLDNATKHLEKIKALSKEERSKYFNKNNDWTSLYSYLSKLSNHKCWYTESLENSSEWEIEHYRPKNEAKNYDGAILRDDGYWWLAYEWRNYRLAGSLVNKLRRDRFGKKGEVFGKGTFFPLDTDIGAVAEPQDMECACEIPLLLDPTNTFDTTLISFDQNGAVFPTNEDDPIYVMRAQLSIKYYGLNHTPLCRGRMKVWTTCEQIVATTQNQLSLAGNNQFDKLAKSTCIENCYIKLSELSESSKPYSKVVYSFVREKLKDDNYRWLGNIMTALQ